MRHTTRNWMACAIFALSVAGALADAGFSEIQEVAVASDSTWWGLSVRYASTPELIWTNTSITGNGWFYVSYWTADWTGVYVYEVDSAAYTVGQYVLGQALAQGDPPVTIQMLLVPETTFTMGRLDTGDDGAYGYANELPRHSVQLSTYTISKCEITNYQFCEALNWAKGQGLLEDPDGTPYTSGSVYCSNQIVVDITDYYSKISYNNGTFEPESHDGESTADHPVLVVSWYGAVCFCNWLSTKESRTPAYDLSTWALTHQFGNGYRLPTEAEWECAAAWDGARHWVYGYQSDVASATRMNANRSNPLGFLNHPFTSPVGYYDGTNETTNSLSYAGCFDMSGNAREWCQDWLDDDYYDGGAMVNPTGPAGPANYRVARGGDWNIPPHLCRTAYRSGYQPYLTRWDIGFRVVIAPEE